MIFFFVCFTVKKYHGTALIELPSAISECCANRVYTHTCCVLPRCFFPFVFPVALLSQEEKKKSTC